MQKADLKTAQILEPDPEPHQMMSYKTARVSYFTDIHFTCE